jgi:tetratricopeptide (TPR) repeat protein
MAALSSIVTFVVQQQGGAVNSLDVMPIELRLANAVVAYVTYLWHMVWPAALAVFYPFRTQISWWTAIGAGALLVGLTVAVLRQRERRPYLPVGWFWYVGTLVPVIGLVQVGTQAFADRYTYVPLVGVWIGLAWLAWEAWGKRPAALAAAQAAILIVLAVVTHTQVQAWQNSHTLWQHAVDVTSDNYRARNSLGAVLGNEGRPADAIVQFTEALRLRPDQSEAFHIHHNLGRALSDLGRVDEAIGHYQEALKMRPDFPEARNNLGLAYARQRHFEPAIAQYELALKQRPGFAPAVANLASAHNELGFQRFGEQQTDAAIAEYTRALAINPKFVLALYNRGFASGAAGRMAEAIADFTAAVGLDPKFEPAQLGLGIALASVGRVDEARRHLTIVLELNPANEGARRALDRLAKRGKQP